MDKRKTLKLEYKQTPRPMGIYQVRNNANGKILVDSSMNLNGGINGTKFKLEAGTHKNTDLQKEWNQYGEGNFTFDILEVLKPSDDLSRDYKDELKTLEEIWLEKLQPYGDKGYHK